MSELHYSLRVLRGAPSVTLACVLMLAIGIGATSGVFSVLNAVLLKPLAFEEFEKLVAVPQTDLQDGSRIGTSMPDLVAYKSGVTTFQSLDAYARSSFSLRGEGLAEQVAGSLVTEQFFSTLGVAAARGRTFSPGDPDGIIVLSNSLWQNMFHSDPGIVGRSVLLDGRSTNVIGVMPQGFWYPDIEGQIWRLLRPDSYLLRETENLHFLHVFGRLNPRTTLQNAQAELGVVNRRLALVSPDLSINLGISVLPLAQDIVGNLRPTLLALMVSVIFILLIACANVVNLQLGRLILRTKEFAIRTAHGATRTRIFWQLLQENLLLSMTGGIAGSGLAMLGIGLALRTNPVAVPGRKPAWIDFTVSAFTLVISGLAGVLCALISIAPVCAPGFLGTLNHQSQRVTSGKRTRLLQHGLIVTEVAAALVLVVGVGLMTKSLLRLSSQEFGFVPDRLLTVSVHLQKTNYPKRDDLDSFRRQISAQISELPEVEAVASASSLPLSGFFENFFSIKGTSVAAADREMVAQSSVSAGYFAMMGIHLREGREFTRFDGPNTERVAIINQRMAQRFWPDRSPLGSRIRHGVPDEPTQWYTVVGIVNDTLPLIGDQPVATIFTSFAQIPEGYDDYLNRSTTIIIRTKRGTPSSIARDVGASISRVDPSLGSKIQTVHQIMSRSLREPSFRAIVFGALGSIAVCLSVVGICGVISTSTASQTRDIATRLVLGASPRDVLKLVIGRGMAVVGIGVVLGLALSLCLARFVRSFLFEVSATDPKSILVAIAVLTCGSLAAIYIPARFAIKVDPAIALRHQ